jgi:hypothetical protein
MRALYIVQRITSFSCRGHPLARYGRYHDRGFVHFARAIIEDTAMSLHVGQQVVCINDVFSPCPYWRRAVRAWPKLGVVYTIRNMREVQELVGLCFF